MEWFVRISGDAFDLDFLLDKFNYHGVLITKEYDNYVLKSEELNQLEEYQDVKPKAIEIFHRVNGIVKALYGTNDLVYEGIYARDGDGGINIFLESSITVRSRMFANGIVVRADGSTDLDIPTDQKWLGKAMEDKEVDTALRLVSKGLDDWISLGRVLDVIKFSVGGEKALKQIGWVPKEEISEFGRAANNPTIAGDDARHGTDSRSPW